MVFEGVNFNDSLVRSMTAEEFEDRHLKVLWLDRDETTRKKMLTEVYGLICKTAKKRKSK